ncbi:centrosome-associated protein 350 isoform X2 [Salarias fasciatus]|uniref:centrosome-associated protein 350 isoform X2 n=1 Tax=Salarias fasciatus TaxID=181472 RepID=UPI0011766A8E|nr:centrosome-associated protein 350 isoform X2 [Salarias fasciatus]
MEEMSSSRRTEVTLESSGQQPSTNHNTDTELTSAWKGLAQSKAALRHIENRIEAAPGTGVCLESIIDSQKKKSSKTVSCRDGRQIDARAGLSKTKCRSQQSPEKSSSRSPLRNTTQDSNVRRNNSVEFREPLASYREATPPPHPASQLEAYSLKSVPGSLYPSFPLSSHPSQLVYQRDTRDKQTDRDLDSTHSSALESTEVRYLNDQPALDTLRTEDSTPKAQLNMGSHELNPFAVQSPASAHQGESTPSSSPGSASQRLENLRRHQPDDRLEKLKERIRRQRQHLEEAAEKEKLLGYLEQPIMAFVESNNAGTSNMPTVKIRKVATAPPAPIYKGFNSTETKIQTPDGKVWKEEDFHNLSREIYRDLSRQFAETTRIKHQQQKEQRADRSKEKRHPKPVRKVHRAAPASDLNAKPVISPASWREGQKLVKMVLGSDPKLPREKESHCPTDRSSRTASCHRSDSSSQLNRRPRLNSTERPQSKFSGQQKRQQTTSSVHLSAAQNKAPVEVSTDLLSADIQGILDDLQLECKEVEEERSRKRSQSGSNGRRGRGSSGSQIRTAVSTWGHAGAEANSSRGCRSASPTTNRSTTSIMADRGHKRRHYDADTVRQYIARQQEERKRRQADEKKAMREEVEKRNQRLQELYRKQRGFAKSEVPVALVQKQFQETYSKLLIEEARLCEETTRTYDAASSSYMRQMYQPSGESDKENKRLEAPQSPSSSDRSLNDQPPPPPPLSRNALDVGVSSLLQPDRVCPAAHPITGSSSSPRTPSGDHLLSHLLRLEKVAGNIQHTEQPAAASFRRSQSKVSRIEALKATAASLSNRIESEARKIAGDGINYNTATSADVDILHTPRASHSNDDCWAEMASRGTENPDMAVRIQRILTSTGHSSYADKALPGTGNLHAFREEMEKNVTLVGPASPCASHVNSQEKRDLLNGSGKVERIEKVAQNKQNEREENPTEIHDSSAGSISEGPLLSEGSFSEDEASCPHPFNGGSPRTVSHVEAADHCTSQTKDHQRLLEFESDAATRLPFAQHNSIRTGWEELNKGSPLSVINIFTKNLCGHVKVSERNSPSAQSEQSDDTRAAAVYQDDFVSSHSSRASAQMKRGCNSPSVNSHFEELMRRSPQEKATGGIYSQHSPFHSSAHSPHYSSASTSDSSPLSRHSTRKKGTPSDHSDATLVEEPSSCSAPSESSYSRKKGSSKSSVNSKAMSAHTNDTLEQHHQGPRMTSPPDDPHTGSPPAADSRSEHMRSGSQGANSSTADTSSHSFKTGVRSTGKLQYSPGVLQQRVAAELQYLESIEDSVRQLGDMERIVGVSMAQQESASLAQMLKAKQQRHERDLYELKIKAEREALEAKLQLEENRQKVAKAHIELQESLAATQRETLEGLQESTTKMMSQQAEAARYTVDAARHIKELAEMARSQIPPGVTDSSTLDQQQSSHLTQQQDKAESDSYQSELSSRRARSEEPPSSLNSLSPSDSLSFKRPDMSGATSGSHHSTSHVSSDYSEQVKNELANRKWRNSGGEGRPDKEVASSSIEEEVATAANDSILSDSIHSALDEKGDSTSVATEYSLKFDESMTEDEIEERSFRSLLPSEAHRRGTMEKSRHHELQDGSVAFSGGQDSFSQFTMDMVRQYMKDEEVRLQHQSSLLHLRQKALKEKTRTELAWLEHQKKRLRDKGEDDKMPPIRKKQRGLLMKLQQEQAEIKRLQEANKAARRERQLLMKQQEEIERMRNSTLRLKERLKCAGGEASPKAPVSELAGSEAASPNTRHSEDIRSPSPSLSVSGSETSSIMQKLKKMHSQMDEKFLTKREQQLIQRRHHAEELLQWKQRLDQEEAEVRRMEKKALAVWNQKMPQDQHELSETPKEETSDVSFQPSHFQSSEDGADSEKEYATEGECPSVPESSIHSERLTSPPASVSKTPLDSNRNSDPNYSPDFTSASQSPSRQPSHKGTHRLAGSSSDGSNKTKMQLRSTSQTPSEVYNQSADPAKSKQLETISNQSDIESRVKALKEEVRKRKLMAYRLKKEQKKRNKERLKAQEASLLKQLQNYNNFIVKTKAELCKEPEVAPDTNSQINESTSFQEPSLDPPCLHRSEESKISDSERTQIGASLDQSALLQQNYSKSTPVPEDLSNEELQTSTVAVYGGKECPTATQGRQQSTEWLSGTSEDHRAKSENDDISDHKSDVLEELEGERNSKADEHSEPLLKLERDSDLDYQSSAPKHASSLTDDEESEHASYVSSKKDGEIKQRQTSEREENQKSKNLASYSPSPSFSDSHSPDSPALPFNKETLTNNIEAPASVDRYHDDFESSVDSSPREDRRSFHAESQVSSSLPKVKGSPASRATTCDSQEEVTEEDIPEELTCRSPNEPSQQSERQLDLDKQPKDFKLDSEHRSSSHSPLQTPVSQEKDEMPGFKIGDRVLVGGVQPGTLRFKGPTSFANGFWAGVELDKSEGSNNGTYDGVVYFQCEESHGIFAPPDKITHLPDKFELYTDTTEDEDSFFDDLSGKGGERPKTNEDNSREQSNHKTEDEKTSFMDTRHGDKKIMGKSQKDQPQLKTTSSFHSQHHKESEHSGSNGDARDIVLKFKDASHSIFISDLESKEITALTERDDFTPVEPTINIRDDIIRKETDIVLVDTFADKLVNTYLKDTLMQFAEIKKAKEQKIASLNQENGDLFSESADREEWITPVDQKDGLPFFLPADKEELSSPELCNRPESPVLGAVGQEELAKRLAELELSRELLDELGDDQDWFDEDFGLSSRREQQRLKQEEEEARLGGGLGRSGSSTVVAMGGMVSSSLEQQVKTPPRPELPLPLPPKLPEQPAMVVPHSAAEVEKMVHAATQEIWERCELGSGEELNLAQLPNPQASQQYLGKEPDSQDPEALSIHSYRKAVYDLTWEILQGIYSEDSNIDQPQWFKPRRAKSSSFHRVKTPGELSKIQEFITAEVLKLYGLAKDQSQKTDWQKMLKFGRKKRDRVDHILVQELHEEEAQWVNYDEDELFVKMQLADSIFDALLKDTADVLTLISDKRAKRDTLS